MVLLGGALLLGIGSWWYRYEAAHRASQFWGPVASRLIAQGEGFEALTLQPESDKSLAAQVSAALKQPTNLDHARGQAHLRHALMSDSNYLWDQPLESSEVKWQWVLRFYEDDRQVLALLSDDLKAIGKLDAAGERVAAFSCEPMAGSVETYFVEIGLIEKSESDVEAGAEPDVETEDASTAESGTAKLQAVGAGEIAE